MYRTVLCCVADSLSVDVQTNNLSIFNQVEEVQSSEFPIVVPKLSFVAVFKRELTEPSLAEGRFSVEIDNVSLLNEGPIQVNFLNSARSRAMIKMEGFAIPRAGRLVFKLELSAGVIAEAELVVTQIPQQLGAQQLQQLGSGTIFT